MRLVIAGQTYYPAKNGQAVFTTHLAEGLALAGHEVLVIAPATRAQPHSYRWQQVQIHTVSEIHLAWLHEDINYHFLPAEEIDRTLKAFQPEIAHIQDHYAISADVVRWMRARGLPIIGTNHFLPDNLIQNLPVLKFRKPASEWLLWQWMTRLYRQLQLITTPSETAAQILRAQRLPVPVLPISCGVDTTLYYPNAQLDRAKVRRQYGLDAARPMLVYVGRLAEEKRLDVLLKAIALVQSTELQLAIAGTGNNHAQLKTLAQELGIATRITFLGHVPAEDLPQLYNAADLFVMPSIAELQSIATLEALASGKPVLAAEACALPELVTHINGYLFQPDEPASAAQQLTQFLRERERWHKMGAASRTLAQQHSLTRTIQRYEQVYTNLLALPRSYQRLPQITAKVKANIAAHLPSLNKKF